MLNPSNPNLNRNNIIITHIDPTPSLQDIINFIETSQHRAPVVIPKTETEDPQKNSKIMTKPNRDTKSKK